MWQAVYEKFKNWTWTFTKAAILTTVSIHGLNAATVHHIFKTKVVFIDTWASLDLFAFLLLPPQADKF